MANTARESKNVSAPRTLVAQAREVNVNISAACEAGLAAEVQAVRAAQWREENREAIAQYNKYIEENGLTLEEYRSF